MVNKLEEKSASKINIGKIEARFFKRLILHDIYVEDFNNDTLLFCKKAEIRIRKINLDHKHIYLNNINLDSLSLYFKDIDEKRLNFKYFWDNLIGKEKSDKPLYVHSNNFNVKNSRFAYTDGRQVKDPKGFNFNDFDLNYLMISAENFRIDSGKLDFNIRDMAFKDHSGLTFKHFISMASISKNGIVFSDPYIETDNSIVIGKKIKFNITSYQDFSDGGIINKVPLEVILDPSNINFKDIAYFAPALILYDQNFIFSGNISGPVNALKGKDISLKIGQSSSIDCNIYFNGLPEMEKTYIHADIKNLYANYNDLVNIKLPGGEGKKINLPDFVEKFGNISYQGSFTGFLKDFFSYGTFTTGLGQINTDISLKPDTNNLLVLNGKVECLNFDAGSFFSSKKLEKTNFLANVNGKISPDSGFIASLSAQINDVVFNDYTYTNIKVSSDISGANIEGAVNINDPNLTGNIQGKFLRLDQIPKIDFTASIDQANMGQLQLSDSSYILGFDVETQLIGKNIDNLLGQVGIQNVQITKRKDSISIGNIDVRIVENETSEKEINLVSDFLDASVKGNMAVSGLISSYKNIIFKYVENLNYSISGSSNHEIDTNTFEYWADVKNIQPILNFLYPDISISEKSYIQGEYNPFQNNYNLYMVSSYVVLDDIIVRGIQCNTKSNDTLLSINAGCEYIMNNQVRFDHLSLYTDLYNSNADFTLRWNNWDSVLYKGNITARAEFLKSRKKGFSNIKVQLFPSNFTVRDTVWFVQQGNVTIDSTFINFDEIKIYNKDQLFAINGAISEDPGDSLVINFNNFSLENMNLLLSKKNTEVDGKLDGEIFISDFYNSRLFFSKLNAKNFAMNKISLGNLYSESSWDKRNKQINFNIKTEKGDIVPVYIEGYVEPTSKELYAEINLDKFRLGFVRPYIAGVSDYINGFGSGKLLLTGTTRTPVLNGEINMQRAEFDIDYLGTRYTFTDKLLVKDNQILIDDITIYDKYGNQAFINGNVKSYYLKDFALDLKINTNKLLFMETTASLNPDFFGTAYASGFINITGPLTNLKFDIRARTEANTEFNVPLTSDASVSEFSFIEYYPKKQKSDEEVYLLSKMLEQSKSTNIILNIDLEVTPDAQIQLIFDSKIGDVIKGRGKGNLKMEINSGGTFKMYGSIEVTEGDYLFTLQNVINKKFQIKSGGTINWDGDPSQAMLDLQAVYNLRANIKPLFKPFFMGSENIAALEKYNKVVPVECQLLLTDDLMNPTKSFGINLPSSGEEIKGMVNNILSTEEELITQFVALMLIKQFVEPSGNENVLNNVATNADAIKVATLELASNQLSHWISQFNDDLNVHFDYSGNAEGVTDELRRQQLEIILSYQMLQNKVTINGEVDVTRQEGTGGQTNDQTLLGDFDVDVKLTENGKLRFKAFNREHTDMTEIDPYNTQGVGFFYREEFNSFGELLNRYYKKLFAWRKEEKELEKEDGN